MSLHMRLARILIASVLAILAGWLAAHVIRVRLAESLYPSPGSFDWYISVSSAIRHMPTPGLTGAPQYFTSAGDGPKPPQDEVTFRSSASQPEILRQIRAYLTPLGYTELPPEPGKPIVFRNEPKQTAVYLAIRPGQPHSEVTITQYE